MKDKKMGLLQENDMPWVLSMPESTKELQEQVMEYRQLICDVSQMELCLEEFCTAIEEFGLACDPAQLSAQGTEDERVIYCRAKSYTPHALLETAREQSDALERATERMEVVRGNLLSSLLLKSQNMQQYEAVRYAFVELQDLLLQNIPRDTQEGGSLPS